MTQGEFMLGKVLTLTQTKKISPSTRDFYSDEDQIKCLNSNYDKDELGNE